MVIGEQYVLERMIVTQLTPRGHRCPKNQLQSSQIVPSRLSLVTFGTDGGFNLGFSSSGDLIGCFEAVSE
jgi:hypothetical protein